MRASVGSSRRGETRSVHVSAPCIACVREAALAGTFLFKRARAWKFFEKPGKDLVCVRTDILDERWLIFL